jgi:hypothetical protein
MKLRKLILRSFEPKIALFLCIFALLFKDITNNDNERVKVRERVRGVKRKNPQVRFQAPQ